ncbi:MAG: sensor histidine kinase [Candidatus Binataceae bacterium]
MAQAAGTPLASVVENPEAELRALVRQWAESANPVRSSLKWKTSDPHPPREVEAWRARPARDQEPALLILRCRSLTANDRIEAMRSEAQVRQQAEAELADAVRVRDEFIAVAAHELRNPLNVFHLSMQLLYRRFGEVEGIRDILNRSQVQLNRLNMLVERLLDVSRIRAGKYELHRERFELSDLIHEVVARFGEQYPQAPISVETDWGITGTWDRGRIDQALTNLLSNAIKYGENKPIVVAVAMLGDEAVVSITDQGIGLAPNDITRIFEQFERAAPQAKSEGFGLGLWITQQIVQAHHGSVSAQGELGKGSTFTLKLPIDPPRL